MPMIQEYNAPAGLKLNPSETGVESTAQAARRIGTFFNQVSEAKQRNGIEIGGAIKDVGDAYDQIETHREISHGAASFAELTANLTDQWNETVKNADPNDPSVSKKFMATVMNPALTTFGNNFTTQGSQKFAEQAVDSFRTHMFAKSTADMGKLAGDAVVVNLGNLKNSLANRSYADDSSLDQALEQYEHGVNSIVGSSPNLKGADAAGVRTTMLEKGKESIVKAAFMGRAERDPEGAEAWLAKGGYGKYIPGEEAKQITAYAKAQQRLARSESNNQRVMQDRQDKVDFHQKMNELEAQTFPTDVGSQPTLPKDYWDRLREISKMPGAQQEPGRLASMAAKAEAMTERLNKPEPLGRISHDTTMDLMGRIWDQKMASDAPIYEAYRNGKLNWADFNRARSEYQNAQSEDGERFNTKQRAFMQEIAAPAITKSNPLMGQKDENGDLQMYHLHMDILDKKVEMRKAGKNPNDMFNPSSPDYIGKDLSQYKTTLQQSLQTKTRNLGGAPVPGIPVPPEQSGLGEGKRVREVIDGKPTGRILTRRGNQLVPE